MGYALGSNPKRKYWTIRGKGDERPIRLHRLGEEYTKERITQRLIENRDNIDFEPFQPKTYRPKQYRLRTRSDRIGKVGGLYGLYLYYCYRLGYLPEYKAGQQNHARVHYLFKEDLMKIDELTKQVTLLGKHHIGTDEQLFSYEHSVEEQIKCYTSVNRGSVAKRLNKGISIEHSCESPYIRLEMMAEQVLDRYIENADKVMNLSYAMLEKHIADQEELPDNTDVIQRKQGEIERLMNKRTNLIEMRAEGDIDKEMFRSKKQEIEDRVAKLTEEIKGLQPEKEQTSNEDYSVKLLELRERLKEYTGFDYSVIPESIVEAFIERIWVSKDEFRWYLRTESNAEGKFDPDDHIKIGSFTLTIDDAKKYIYSFSTRRRVYKWVDLNVSVWI